MSLCANTDLQRVSPSKSARRRNSIFTKGPAGLLDHATSEMAMGTKLGIDAMKKLPGEP